jgi:hypothetical protein
LEFVKALLEIGGEIGAAFDEGLPANWRNLTFPEILRLGT